MNSQKLRDVKKLVASKCYILITDKEGILAGDFKGFSGIMKIHSLQLMIRNAEKLVKRLQGEGKSTKEKPNGRNNRGRAKSSSKKQRKVR